ncbi:class I SAM-dependent methyltransferase [Streptomyces sp. NPDC017529]|uniref:class I SAM-dependent methyltransferase n=1 Tax=Streptomyces sp. NPDC017529 TaxID=3365000 RepID=UPI0037A55087
MNATPVPATSAAPAVTGPLRFLREAVRTPHTTGAVAASGPRLAARLAAPLARELRQLGRPAAVLEAGAGTGPVTRALAGLLRPADHLDVVEINPRFVAVLDRALRTDPALAAAAGRIRIVPGSITDVPLDRRYDAVVSCLPFTNFCPEEVRTILERYLSALVPGGHLTYFGYLGTAAARSLGASRSEAARHRAVAAVLAEYAERYGRGRSTVWRNLPPAHVHHLRAPEGARSA